MEIENVNNVKIQKYKQAIEKMIKIRRYDLEERNRKDIETLLDNDLKNNKITEDEYDILNEYMENIVNNIINEQSKDNIEDTKKSFRERIEGTKSESHIVDATTMYKGKLGEEPPRRFTDNER